MKLIQALSLLAVGVGSALAAPLDVWTPQVLVPNNTTVWTVGQVTNITWDASNPPQRFSNNGLALLRWGDDITPIVLAYDFELTAGSVEITVPLVVPDDDYSIVLFGDSGNYSPGYFTINSPVDDF